MNHYRFIYTIYGKHIYECVTLDTSIYSNDTIDEAKEKLFKLYGDSQIMLIQSEVIHDEDIYC